MRGWRGVLLALVCLAGLAGLAAGCGGGEETVTVVETAPADTGPEDDGTSGANDDDREGPEATEETEAGPGPEVETDPRLFDSFQTPSGNIACILSDEGARCDIADRSWQAPRPSGCPSQLDFGQGLIVEDGDGPGQVVCAGDTTLDPSAPVLAYGESTSVGDFTCTSEEDGVTCRDDGDNRGFFISKQSYRLF